MIYFYDANEPTDDDPDCDLKMHERRLIIDIAGDVRRINDIAQFAHQTGASAMMSDERESGRRRRGAV